MQDTKNQVSEETQQKIQELVKNDLILPGKTFGIFLDSYMDWNTAERRLFQDSLLRKEFWYSFIIIPVWNALKARHFEVVDGFEQGQGLYPDQKELLNKMAPSLWELVKIENDITLKLRWARMLLLVPETRFAHANQLLAQQINDDANFINALATDIVNQAKKKKEQPWWKQLFG